MSGPASGPFGSRIRGYEANGGGLMGASGLASWDFSWADGRVI